MKPQSYFTRCAMTLFILLPLVAIAPPKTFAGSEPHKLNVLFLSSFTKDIPAQSAIESGLNQALAFSRGQYDLFFEFIDNPRLRQQGVIAALPRYLEAKYQGIDFDFVVGWGIFASLFLSTNNELFADAHRIYVEAIGVDLFEGRDPTEKETVIVVEPDFARTYQEMLRLEHPQKIYVIGATTDIESQAMVQIFKNTFPALASYLEVEYLVDRTLEQVATTLEGITRKDEVAFFLLMFSDGEGTNMTPYAVVNRIASRSAVPIYCFFEPLIGSGIVGGYLLSYENVGLHLGRTMLAIDGGEAVPSFSPMRYVYDWRALQRWNIAASRLPDGAVFVNRPPDIFVQYHWHMLGMLILLMVLISLSLLLYRALSRSKQAEAALARNEANLTSAQEVARIGGFLFDIPKNRLAWIEGTKQVFGVPTVSNPGYRTFLSILHADDRQTVDKHWKAALKGQPCDIDCRVIIGEDTRWMRVRVEVESDGLGQPRLLKGIIQDITDRKKSEIEAARLRHDLAHVTRVATMGELSRNIAHEVNQPLAASLMNAEAALNLLKETAPDLEEIREALGEIVADQKRAREVIQRIRGLIKKDPPALMRLDLNDLVNEAVKVVQAEAAAKAALIHLELDFGLPPVWGDRVQLQQVLINLLVNALDAIERKASGQGRITVKTAVDNADFISLSVSDNGEGIDAETAGRLFEPFFTTKSQGMGLGLSISRSIVESHGGTIRVAANADHSATFKISLPKVAPECAGGDLDACPRIGV